MKRWKKNWVRFWITTALWKQLIVLFVFTILMFMWTMTLSMEIATNKIKESPVTELKK